jgi:hypothetical protein
MLNKITIQNGKYTVLGPPTKAKVGSGAIEEAVRIPC